MSRLLLLALLLVSLLAARPARAQDVLTRRDGTEILVKVLELTPTLVRYRRTDNLDGPLISVLRTEVFRIRYANGVQEVVTPGAAPAAAAYVPADASTAAPYPPAAPTAGAYPPQTPPVAAAAAPSYAPPPAPTVVPGDEPSVGTVQLSGPRLGFTILTDGVLERARNTVEGRDLNPFLTQFSWQFETRLFRMPNGMSGLIELVPLIGGLEQSKFIPSVSAVLGLRGPKGFEFGVGPNVTPLGAGLVLVGGTSFRSNGVNFPINLAVAPGQGGVRVSLLVGFNSRRY